MSWRPGVVDGSRVDWPRVLLVALAVAIVGTLGVLATTSGGAFGPYNPTWDGTSDFRQQLEDDPAVESELVRETSRYDEVEPEGTVAFVVAPEDRYGPEDAERVRRFVRAGGTLVVLENFGATGEELLADVGADARLDGRVLRDERDHRGATTLPVATDVENHSTTVGVDRLSLNYATAVDPGGATVLVRTSEFAHLTDDAADDSPTDLEADDDLDPETDLDSYPVATIEDVGDGRVLVVGDPSIAINAMVSEPDNAAFLRNAYAGEQRVLVDVSHDDSVPPLVGAVLAIRARPLLSLLVGAFAVGGVAAFSNDRARGAVARASSRLPTSVFRTASRVLPASRSLGTSRSSSADGSRTGSSPDRSVVSGSSTGPGRSADTGLAGDPGLAGDTGVATSAGRGAGPRLSADQQAAFLRRRYPEWDDERIERMVTAINRTRVVRDDE